MDKALALSGRHDSTGMHETWPSMVIKRSNHKNCTILLIKIIKTNVCPYSERRLNFRPWFKWNNVDHSANCQVYGHHYS